MSSLLRFGCSESESRRCSREHREEVSGLMGVAAGPMLEEEQRSVRDHKL